MSFFTKEEIITRMKEKRAELGTGARADMNMALLILGSALFDKKLKSGADYGEHPVIVGMRNTRSNTKRIIGILHDVLEDSDWEADDLRAVGFSERIVLAVDAMTHREGELYLDSIRRCSLNKDAVDKKIEDLSHNMDTSRNTLFLKEKDVKRIHKYMIARSYLLAVKKGDIKPGTPVENFVTSSDLFQDKQQALRLTEEFSSHAAAKRKPANQNTQKPKTPKHG